MRPSSPVTASSSKREFASCTERSPAARCDPGTSRSAERAEELWGRLEALTIEWGGTLPFPPKHAASRSEAAIQAMGELWRAAQDRWGVDIPVAWSLAGVVFGSGLLASRVDPPWPIVRSRVGLFEPPRPAPIDTACVTYGGGKQRPGAGAVS